MLKYLENCALGCSPLVFAAMLIAMTGWGFQKARNQFKPRFLLLFSMPLFGLELLLSVGQSATVDSTLPAFLGLLILSVALWQEAVKAGRNKKIFAFAAAGIGLVMSLWATGFDLLSCHFTGGRKTQVSHSESGDLLLGWESAASAIDHRRKQFEHDTGKPVFLIGNGNQIASILAFYLPDKRVEGPGHPPVYIPESQMIESQFSYWPRYDEFVSTPKGTQPADAYYTEEQGTNPFMDRTAFFISNDESDEPPSAIRNSFERVEKIAGWKLVAHGIIGSDLSLFVCYNYRSLPL
jgi:hypothetical protein